MRHLVARLRGNTFRRPFRWYVKSKGAKAPTFVRYTETRYAAIDIMCQTFWQYRGFVILFFHLVRHLLTEADLKALKVVLDPEMADIIFIRALLASQVLLPSMKEAKTKTSPAEYSKKLDALKGEVRTMALSPNLLSNATLETADAKVMEEVNSVLAGLQGEVQTKLTTPDILPKSDTRANQRTQEAFRLVGAPTTAAEDDDQDDDKDQDDQEDSEDEEQEDGEDEDETATTAVTTTTTTTTPVAVLDLRHPSKKLTAQPALQEKRLIHCGDAAKAFLFKQEAHNTSWTGSEVALMDATSRAVERIFAVTKVLMERNTQIRAHVLNCLLVPRDIDQKLLVDIWEEHKGRDIRKKARLAIKANPTTSAVDELYYHHLEEKIAAEQVKVDKKEKEKQLTDLVAKKLLETPAATTTTTETFIATLAASGKTLKRPQLVECLGKATMKRMRRENNGKEPTKKMLENEIMKSHTGQATVNATRPPAALMLEN